MRFSPLIEPKILSEQCRHVTIDGSTGLVTYAPPPIEQLSGNCTDPPQITIPWSSKYIESTYFGASKKCKGPALGHLEFQGSLPPLPFGSCDHGTRFKVESGVVVSGARKHHVQISPITYNAIYVYVHIYIYVYVYICVHIHMYSYTVIYTYIDR